MSDLRTIDLIVQKDSSLVKDRSFVKDRYLLVWQCGLGSLPVAADLQFAVVFLHLIHLLKLFLKNGCLVIIPAGQF